MEIATSELFDKLKALAEKVVNEESATYYAGEVIEAHVRKSPRNDVLTSAIKDVLASIKHKDVTVEFVKDLGATAVIDFHSHGPLTFIKKIHDEAEDRSNKYGISLLAFRNSQGMHTLHAWVQGLAKRGLVALACNNGGPDAVIPFNGTKGLFGTNPFAYGLPGKDGAIQCVDMATSEAPFFEIMRAHESKTDLREGIAVDQAGEPTTKTSEALDFSESEDDPVSNLVPMGGGYKGYLLVYLFELLTSGLIGAPSSSEMSTEYIPEEHGSILITFSPQALGTNNTLLKSLEVLNADILSQTARKGTEILLPGDTNNKKWNIASKDVIEIKDTTFELLNNALK